MTATKPGIYKHYKGASYRVLATSTMSTTGDLDGEPMIEYMSLSNGQKFVTPESRFHASVNKNAGDKSAPCLCDARGQDSCRKHPGDPKMVPRFTLTKEL